MCTPVLNATASADMCDSVRLVQQQGSTQNPTHLRSAAPLFHIVARELTVGVKAPDNESAGERASAALDGNDALGTTNADAWREPMQPIAITAAEATDGRCRLSPDLDFCARVGIMV